MSVSKWAYKPVTCDDGNCCGDCDHCDHIPVDLNVEFYDKLIDTLLEVYKDEDDLMPDYIRYTASNLAEAIEKWIHPERFEDG